LAGCKERKDLAVSVTPSGRLSPTAKKARRTPLGYPLNAMRGPKDYVNHSSPNGPAAKKSPHAAGKGDSSSMQAKRCRKIEARTPENKESVRANTPVNLDPTTREQSNAKELRNKRELGPHTGGFQACPVCPSGSGKAICPTSFRG
jgi:hypothetical protein